MLKLLDRQLVFNYLKAFLVCLISLMGLFIVVDLFMNLDDFGQGGSGLESVLGHVWVFYSQKSLQIFDRLCESIVLLAAMFTVAWMQRHNELLPLLSAGVSTRRAIRPVLLAGCLMLGLAVLNQELILPTIDAYLMDNRSDWKGDKEKPVAGAYESNGLHISGRTAVRSEMLIKDFLCVVPPQLGGPFPIQAKEGRYIPPGPGEKTGGWRLRDARPAEISTGQFADFLEPLGSGQYFLKTYDVDFDLVTRQKNWFMFVSTWDLLREMGKTSGAKLASLAVIFHMRLTRPILGILLVFMGLSIILWDQNRNIFISAGLCLILSAIFFAAWFGCKHLGDHGVLSPALAAWLPVIVFGPLSFVMFDAVHT